MPGRLIQLTETLANGDEDRFQFNRNFARSMESSEKLAASPVVIVSVAGAFRKGKSFLLNFFLRYLRALSGGDTRDWIHSAHQLDDGFPWRSGAERDTTGILVWSEPFFIRKSDGKEVAVLLMDTQGTFDHQSTQQDCTNIFAFSTLMSSVQIFNISKNIQETDLQNLRLFIEFASMAKNSREKVLQHLWFLIRDWQNPDEYPYGAAGGNEYLMKVLACDDEKPKENQELRRGIRQQFEMASCFLLPYPGKEVTRKDFRGQVHRLDKDFVEHLDQFVHKILSPENLVVKRVNCNELTGRELFTLVEVYFEAFRLGKLPTPKSIFTATVEMANQTAADDAVKHFENSVSSHAGPTTISDQDLNGILTKMLEEAMDQFDSRCMDRGSPDTARARDKLDTQLRALFQRQQMLNKLKSDKIEAEEKNRMLMGDMKRMQDESVENVQRIQQMELDFAEKIKEIKSSHITKEEMKETLQNELVKHSARQRELDRQNRALMERISKTEESKQKVISDLKGSKEAAINEQEAMRKDFERRMAAAEEERQRAARKSSNWFASIAKWCRGLFS